jgi:hypothetical protein
MAVEEAAPTAGMRDARALRAVRAMPNDEDEEDAELRAFFVLTPTKSFKVFASTAAAAREWIAALRSRIGEVRLSEGIEPPVSEELRPVCVACALLLQNRALTRGCARAKTQLGPGLAQQGLHEVRQAVQPDPAEAPLPPLRYVWPPVARALTVLPSRRAGVRAVLAEPHAEPDAGRRRGPV